MDTQNLTLLRKSLDELIDKAVLAAQIIDRIESDYAREYARGEMVTALDEEREALTEVESDQYRKTGEYS